MARIIYAVAGEGFGHASRAHLIGQRLLDAGHEVLFVSSHRGLAYLRQYYGDPWPGSRVTGHAARVAEIFGLTFDYSRGYVAPAATVWKNLSQLVYANRFNRRLFEGVYRPFNPDLVLTDFEPFTGWWAWRHRVPFLSIGHEHMLILCKLEHQWRHLIPRLTSTVVTRLHYLGARAYVVLNFFDAPLKGKLEIRNSRFEIPAAAARLPDGQAGGRVFLAPLVVRPAVTEVKPSDDGHIVVYSTTGTHQDRLRAVLGRFPDREFHVYGFDTGPGPRGTGHVLFKDRSLEGFLADVASAHGVIASAGSSLLAECLYLRKKMLLLPLPGQYEQFLNAYYAEKLGLAQWTWQLNVPGVARFLERIEEPLGQDPARPAGGPRILWPDNERFFAVLRGVLANLDLPVRVSL